MVDTIVKSVKDDCKVVEFIKECCRSLRFRTDTLTTACVLYHRVRECDAAADGFEVAACCMFIAGKVENHFRKARDVVNVCHWVEHGEVLDIGDTLFDGKEVLFNREKVVLRQLGFDCRVAKPHAYLLQFVQAFCTPALGARCAQLACIFLNDALAAPFCAHHPAPLLAAGALHAAEIVLGCYSQTANPLWPSSIPLPLEEVRAVCSKFFQLYHTNVDRCMYTITEDAKEFRKALYKLGDVCGVWGDDAVQQVLGCVGWLVTAAADGALLLVVDVNAGGGGADGYVIRWVPYLCVS